MMSCSTSQSIACVERWHLILASSHRCSAVKRVVGNECLHVLVFDIEPRGRLFIGRPQTGTAETRPPGGGRAGPRSGTRLPSPSCVGWLHPEHASADRTPHCEELLSSSLSSSAMVSSSSATNASSRSARRTLSVHVDVPRVSPARSSSPTEGAVHVTPLSRFHQNLLEGPRNRECSRPSYLESRAPRQKCRVAVVCNVGTR